MGWVLAEEEAKKERNHAKPQFLGEAAAKTRGSGYKIAGYIHGTVRSRRAYRNVCVTWLDCKTIHF